MSSLSRREFLQILQSLGLVALASSCSAKKTPFLRESTVTDLYDSQERSTDVRLIHFSDVHAQLLPNHFREPTDSIGYKSLSRQTVWRPGAGVLGQNQIEAGSILAHALTSDNFDELAITYGKTGGFSHILTLIKQLRDQAGTDKCLLLDGGDSWQGSATAMWTRGEDMVQASNIMGVDLMTAHWEFTLGAEQVNRNLTKFEGEFVAQNVFLRDEAHLEDLQREPDKDNRVFNPWQMRVVGGNQIAVIGQAYPYTPVAHPGSFTPQWTFGVRYKELARLVRRIRADHPQAAVVLLSHNGLGIDLQLAERVSGIDLILGGHTHDPVFGSIEIANRAGVTHVTNAGCAGKFLNVCDLKFSRRGLRSIDCRLLPVFSKHLPADPTMQAYIDNLRLPHRNDLEWTVTTPAQTLYRRGNFNGTVDELILRVLSESLDAPICFSPGFRWGNTIVGDTSVTMEDIYSWTAISYPRAFRRQMTGREIWQYLEDVADNFLNDNAFLQQGGDMVRTRGLTYRLDLSSIRGYRISDLRLSSGELVQADTNYTVAGWADANAPESQLGGYMWDLLREWLQANQFWEQESAPFRPQLI